MSTLFEDIRRSIAVGKGQYRLPMIRDLIAFISQYRHSFVSNSLWLALGEIAAKLFMFYVVIAVVRYLQPAEYGQLSLSIALANLFVFLLDFGMTKIIIRDLSRQRRRASIYLSQAISLKIVLGGVYCVILLLLPEHLISREWMWILLLIGFMNWTQDLSGTFISWFMAAERMEKVLIVQLVHYGGIFLATWAAIHFNAGLTVLVAGQCIAAIAGLSMAAVMTLLEGITIRLVFMPELIRYLIRQSLPLCGMIVIACVYANADTIMVRLYKNINDVAFYQAACKFLFVMQGLVLLHAALFPRLSILVKADQKGQTRLLHWIVALFSVIFLAPVAVLVTIYTPEILNFVYGEKMLPAAGALRLLVWVGVVFFIKAYIVNIFVAHGEQKPLFLIALTALVLYLILNAYFLAHHSFVAAAGVLLATESFMLAVMLVVRFLKTGRLNSFFYAFNVLRFLSQIRLKIFPPRQRFDDIMAQNAARQEQWLTEARKVIGGGEGVGRD